MVGFKQTDYENCAPGLSKEAQHLLTKEVPATPSHYGPFMKYNASEKHESNLLHTYVQGVQSVTKIHIYLFLKYVFFAYISGTSWSTKELFTGSTICSETLNFVDYESAD